MTRRSTPEGLGLLTLALVSLWACPKPWPLPAPDLAARALAARSYSARLRVSLKGREVRARSQALVAFRRPDALRLEVPGPSGARVLVVVRGESLTAVFPGDRAVFRSGARAEDLDALLGVPLAPAEVMDLLVGAPSPRLRSFRARWGPVLPSRIDAVLPDGGRLKVNVEDADAGVALPEAAFVEPPHAGYRQVGAEEARMLWR